MNDRMNSRVLLASAVAGCCVLVAAPDASGQAPAAGQAEATPQLEEVLVTAR
jgi:hypothetical protein